MASSSGMMFRRVALGSPKIQARSIVLPIERKPLAKYGGRHTVTVLPGDGIGPEMMDHLKRVFTFAHVPVDFEVIDVSSRDPTDNALENAIIAIERNGVALKGNIETKFDDPQFKSRNVELRKRLDLFANILQCKTIPTIPTRHKELDIVLIRENTEGEYSGMEHETIKGVVESLKVVTRAKIEQIAKFAFEYALANNRNKITAVHKANIQKLGDGLFLKICREMAETQYKNVKFEHMIVDNASMQLVSRPEQFNGGIMLMPNLYGNIISNIACGLVGGPGLVSGMNLGKKYAVFETGTRNTGTSLVGKDAANPVAFIQAGIDMLHYLNEPTHAERLQKALHKALVDKKLHTADIGGSNKTSEVVNGVIEQVKQIFDQENIRY